MACVAAAISRTAAQSDGGADDWLANSSSDSGRECISSVFPSTPFQPRSRMRSTISVGFDPLSAKSPPCSMRSGEVSRRSVKTASNAVRLPWMSDTIAMRTDRHASGHDVTASAHVPNAASCIRLFAVSSATRQLYRSKHFLVRSDKRASREERNSHNALFFMKPDGAWL
jgi:hypothetical protein